MPSKNYTVSQTSQTSPVHLNGNRSSSKKKPTVLEKILSFAIGLGKAIGLLVCLYFFVCSLDTLSLGFRIVGGRTTGNIFRNSEFLRNPVVGVMVGILTTVLVQSSSTSTSIIVSMVASGLLDVHGAVPIVMGANIGTSVTNTIVSLAQAGDRGQFEKAFAGATVHDMFNWLTVIVLLVIEVTTGYLETVSGFLVTALVNDTRQDGNIEILGKITKPFVNLIVQIDKKVLECWTQQNCTKHDNSSLIKRNCAKVLKTKIGTGIMLTSTELSIDETMTTMTFDENVTEAYDIMSSTTVAPVPFKQCNFLFAWLDWGDTASGIVILLVSLAVLCLCLVVIVKILVSVLEGNITVVIKKTLNAKVPYIPWITGYLALLVGAVMTFLVQSSSVFTSALTPLVGLDILTVERVYPLTLGSNIGTTTTAIIASLAVDVKALVPSLQIALCHLLFNLTGIALFYPIPFMRFPIGMAKFLGKTTAKYRWFSLVYMLLMFVALPCLFMGLSFAGPTYVIVVASIICAIFLLVIGINFVRTNFPWALPKVLRSWKWLPVWFRSLEPYDRIFFRVACCKKFQHSDDQPSAPPVLYERSGDQIRLEVQQRQPSGLYNPAFAE